MTELALGTAETPALGRLSSYHFGLMAPGAWRPCMATGKRPSRGRLVIEIRNLERGGGVTRSALQRRCSEPELTQVRVVVATSAVSGDASVTAPVP